MTGGGVMTTPGGDSHVDPKNQKFTFAIFKVAALSAIGGFLFGYDTGIVSGAMVFIKEDFNLSDRWQELIISITLVGAWIFSMFAGYFTDKFGRKKVIYAASLIFTAGAIMMGLAWNKYALMAGRFVVGAAIGFASMVVPMYIAEMAPAHVRGSLVTMNNLFIAGGQAVAGVVAGLLSEVHEGWRYMLGLAAIPAIIQFIGFLFMPESPRWLVRQNQDYKAMEVLQKIRGPDADIDDEYQNMKDTCKLVEGEEVRGTFAILRDVLKDKYLRKALMLGCMLQAIQQLTGINTVMYYSATIIQMSGVYDKSTAVWLAALTAMINFLCNFIGIYLVEKIGRRSLTLGSLLGVILSLCVLAVGFQAGAYVAPGVTTVSTEKFDAACIGFTGCNECTSSESCGFCFDDLGHGQANGSCIAVNALDPALKSLGGRCAKGTIAEDKLVWAKDWCPSKYSISTLIGLCLYLLFFSPGMGPMPWTINSEIYPLWARSACFSTSTAFNWFFNLLVSLTFLDLTKAITKYGAFYLYAGFGAFGFVYFFVALPETKGKSLEDTAQLFGSGGSRRSSKTGSTVSSSDSRPI
ncbi:Proton myo-inositol cotransporter [Halotydeus destructor]|nr:Proton myo-inositol cotransporter [Halotydeus destructor]